MAIPESVRKQGEQADEVLRQHSEHPSEGSEPTDNQDPQHPQNQQEPQEEPAPAPEEPKPQKDPESLSVDEANQELNQPLPPTPDPDTEEGAWERRYKVLKGKYDKEVAQLNRRIRDMEQQAQQPPQEQPAPAQQPQGDLSQLREEYGPDDPMVKALEASEARNQRLEQQVQSLQGQHQNSSEEAFWTHVNDQVPDWDTINQRSEWLTWLNHPDPVSGEVRQDLLERHQQNYNGAGVVALFNQFLSEHPQVKAELRQTQPPADPRREKLEQQVEPARSQAQPEPEQDPVYPHSEVSRFYTDITKGRYRDRPQEAAQWEETYTRAAQEGRIDYDR